MSVEKLKSFGIDHNTALRAIGTLSASTLATILNWIERKGEMGAKVFKAALPSLLSGDRASTLIASAEAVENHVRAEVAAMQALPAVEEAATELAPAPQVSQAPTQTPPSEGKRKR